MVIANETPPPDSHTYYAGSFEAAGSFNSAVTHLSHGTPAVLATTPSKEISGRDHSPHNAITGETVEYDADSVKQEEVLACQGKELEKWRVAAQEELQTFATRDVYSIATPAQAKEYGPALPMQCVWTRKRPGQSGV